MSKIAIIGGSGFYDQELIEEIEEVSIDTPFGLPSDTFTTGKIDGKSVIFFARHGRDHSIMPTKVPYQANIWALKELGCTHILATTACGSMREEIKPGDFIFVDQFIDMTKHRNLTFYEDKVIHTPMAEPFCGYLRSILSEAADRLNIRHHNKGTMITIEGPRFSTKAESRMFRILGADVINMSTVPEVILARELGICYQSIAMATDYDCWKEGEESVTWDLIKERMVDNVARAKELIREAIRIIEIKDCDCAK